MTSNIPLSVRETRFWSPRIVSKKNHPLVHTPDLDKSMQRNMTRGKSYMANKFNFTGTTYLGYFGTLDCGHLALFLKKRNLLNYYLLQRLASYKVL